jgi:hypothetical protein
MRKLKFAALTLVGLLVLCLAIPVGIVAARGSSLNELLQINFANGQKRAMIAEAARPYGLPVDTTLTPMQAGELMYSMRAEADRDGRAFKFRTDVPAVRPHWLDTPFDTTLFPGMRQLGWTGADPEAILAIAAARPTAAQRAYLNAIAADPIWRVWDQVGSAASIDVLGGQFEIPFSPQALWHGMPIPKFAATKDVAYAGVSRAAAHLAAQRPDSAEHALRSIIAFGFAMHDNAPSMIEQLIGIVIVGIGRDGLQRFYTIRNDPRGAQLAARVDSLTKQSEAGGALPTLRGMNVEMAVQPALAPCTNVKELVFGRSEANQAKLDSLRADVARFPSEQAYFDLIEATVEGGALAGFAKERSPGLVMRAIYGASTVAGKVMGNPRMPMCAVLVTTAF